MAITHEKVSAVSDGGDSSLVRPSDWNADHVGTAVGLYFPDLPPDSPHSNDDEFDDASLDTGVWTEWDPGDHVAVSEGDFGLRLGHNVTLPAWGGIYRTMPSSGSDWSLTTKIQVTGSLDTQFWPAIFLAEDLGSDPSNADLLTWGFALLGSGGGGGSLRLTHWSDYDSWSSDYLSRPFDGHNVDYFRIRHATSGGWYWFDWSNDGIGWVKWYGTNTPGFTPVDVGLAFYAQNDAVPAYFRFWRQTDSAAIDQPLAGRFA